jgi:hypothetical protein
MLGLDRNPTFCHGASLRACLENDGALFFLCSF